MADLKTDINTGKKDERGNVIYRAECCLDCKKPHEKPVEYTIQSTALYNAAMCEYCRNKCEYCGEQWSNTHECHGTRADEHFQRMVERDYQ